MGTPNTGHPSRRVRGRVTKMTMYGWRGEKKRRMRRKGVGSPTAIESPEIVWELCKGRTHGGTWSEKGKGGRAWSRVKNFTGG